MSPEEKAYEIKALYDNHTIRTEHAINFAIICVEEIIRSWKLDGNPRLDGGVIHWWNEVKHELHKQLDIEVKQRIAFNVKKDNKK